MQKAALLDGTARLYASAGVLEEVTRGPAVVDGAREVGDVLGDGVLGADGARVDGIGLAGLGEGVVARVEVFALLEVLGEVVGAGGEFAVEAEEALFLGGEGLLKS